MKDFRTVKDSILKSTNDPRSERIEIYLSNVEKFMEISNELGKPIAQKKMKLYDIPSAPYYYRNHPNKSINSYSKFCIELGFIPNSGKTKDQVIPHILKKQKLLGRNLMFDDFTGKNDSVVSVSTIKRLWGSFNNMLLELGFEINQQDMRERHKDVEEMKLEILRLCEYIKSTYNREIISYRDINECEWCSYSGTYTMAFQQHLGMTAAEYINSIGYKTNQCGLGMIFEFSEGDKTTSQYEFNVSTFLRDRDIQYNRNIPYREFIGSYSKNKDCDYVINLNGTLWYIEIAGMIDDKCIDITDPSSVKDKIHRKYLIDILEKEKMFIDQKLNYKILYPSMLTIGKLDETFSFITNK